MTNSKLQVTINLMITCFNRSLKDVFNRFFLVKSRSRVLKKRSRGPHYVFSASLMNGSWVFPLNRFRGWFLENPHNPENPFPYREPENSTPPTSLPRTWFYRQPIFLTLTIWSPRTYYTRTHLWLVDHIWPVWNVDSLDSWNALTIWPIWPNNI